MTDRRQLPQAFQKQRKVPRVRPKPSDKERSDNPRSSETLELMAYPCRCVYWIRGVECQELKLAEQQLEPLPENHTRAIRRGAGEDKERGAPRHHSLA